ncbi:hypothetical protein psyc5s11_50380 [Clostridium gelidum]|uniref:Cadherin-like beta-sandwich-like domain-containing protein n=1 Tax=Clostridium gelidum TaxID=704125 RepID=A0ABM7TAG7_9CLOT|nr:cadherin-like beta sandwich domain-containing protein [Clostridium gelidum]BCZ48971.1 hypothetical protein psyc5s11_50380 [Clostridium gelidum]
MNKIGKRFVALVIVFASIMSFLPIQFGLNGQAAKAITTQIKVSGKATEAGDNITITDGEYCTKEPYNNFTIAVDYKIVDDIHNIEIKDTGVTEQEVLIKSIDGIKLDGNDVINDNKKLEAIGATISPGTTVYTNTQDGSKTIGATIAKLPYGVNKIEYQIREKTRFNKPITSIDSNGKTVTTGELQDPVENIAPSSETTEEIVIQHANQFVQGNIDVMSFDAYTGGTMAVYDTNKDLKDSKAPFLFTTENVTADKNCPLKYNYPVTNAIRTLRYSMHFNNITVNEATILKNGKDDTGNMAVNGNTISGYLTNMGSSDLIVAKIIEGKNNVVSTYAIQLKYTTINTNDDYTLRDAGITKLNYNEDSDVKAYVDKEFKVTSEGGVPTYTGTMSINKMAGMISMEPKLGKPASDTAFIISNHYDGSGGVADSKIINGKSYVDFAKGSISNEIWVEVYPGKDGNKTGNILARYKFLVRFEGAQSSTVNFNFTDSTLTQPGRSKTDAILFNSDRRSYDVHSDSESINVELDKPVTYGIDGNRREYIKAWGSASVNSDNLTEILNSDKKNILALDVSAYKKIILQGYYEDIVYQKDASGVILIDPISKEKVIKSKTEYPIGEKYAFYIVKNAGTPDPTTGTTSSDASLSNVKAGNGTVKSTDNINYTVKVPKIDTSSGITVTATNSKVKDISATIVETGDEYGLTSGESFDFPLNTSGTTNIKVVVTAEDGITSKTYYITVTNDTRSASALLKNVVTDNGDFTFDPEASINKIRVDQVIKKLKVAPVPTDSKSKVTVNGTKFSGSPITIDLAGSQQTDMTITVVSEDGSDSKTYSFEIYRTDAALDNPDDNTNQDDVFYDDIDNCWVDTSKYEEWGKVKGKDIYFNNKGRQVKEQWINTKNTWYYLNSNGYKTSGWRKDIGGKSYYLDPTTGELKTGWMNINNKMYYLGLNGVMQKGWLYLNGKWHYFTPEGEMVTNQSMFINDKVYNFGQDGVMY